jgi:hypothetical protein
MSTAEEKKEDQLNSVSPPLPSTNPETSTGDEKVLELSSDPPPSKVSLFSHFLL